MFYHNSGSIPWLKAHLNSFNQIGNDQRNDDLWALSFKFPQSVRVQCDLWLASKLQSGVVLRQRVKQPQNFLCHWVSCVRISAVQVSAVMSFNALICACQNALRASLCLRLWWRWIHWHTTAPNRQRTAKNTDAIQTHGAEATAARRNSTTTGKYHPCAEGNTLELLLVAEHRKLAS